MNQTYFNSIILIIMLITAAFIHVTEPYAETKGDETAFSRSYQIDNDDTQNKNHRRPPGGSPLMQVLDADKDRTLSADEISNASIALSALDKDGDGMISSPELRPGPPPSRQGNRPR